MAKSYISPHLLDDSENFPMRALAEEALKENSRESTAPMDLPTDELAEAAVQAERDAVVIESIRVAPRRIICDLRLADTSPRYTNPGIAERARKLLPNLPNHACVNDEGERFEDVMEHTDIPHLLEHMVIDLQTQASRNPDRVFTGLTRWSATDETKARIEMSFEDDLVAIRAFCDAVKLLNRKVLG